MFPVLAPVSAYAKINAMLQQVCVTDIMLASEPVWNVLSNRSALCSTWINSKNTRSFMKMPQKTGPVDASAQAKARNFVNMFPMNV